MIKISNKPKFKALIALLSILIVSGIVYAAKTVRPKEAKQVVQEAEEEKAVPLTYKAEHLLKLKEWAELFDKNKESIFYKGKLTSIDEAQIENNVNNLAFEIARSGRTSYCRLGETEVINVDSTGIQVDHSARKVMVHRQMTDVSTSMLMIARLKDLAAKLRSEDYRLDYATGEGIEKISLINEHHITCKQYTLEYDTAKQRISKIFIRLTNLEEPLSKDNEREISFEIEEFTTHPDMSRYESIKKLLEEGKKGEKLLGKYQAYELINL